MKRSLIAISGFTVAATSYGADVPSEIRIQYKKIEQCIVKPDVRTFKTFFAASFVNVDDQGTVTAYPAFMKQVDGLFAGAISGTAKEKLRTAKVYPDRVEVDFDLTFSLETKKSVLSGHEVGIDTWKKIGGLWRLVKTVDRVFTVSRMDVHLVGRH